MCGIAGIVGEQTGFLEMMLERMAHRGPDDRGIYRGRGVALGIKRLAIIDPTGGNQPLANEDRTVWCVHNGEIYNHRGLRAGLEGRGHRVRSGSDGEVIPHLYEEEGAAFVARLEGMYALALWDEGKRELLVVRDRLGIKPFYYWQNGPNLVFASEVKAILAMPGLTARPDPAAIDQYLTFRYVPAPHTLFRGIKKLPPGHSLRFREGRLDISPYWDLSFPARDQNPLSEEDYAAGVWRLFREAVSSHLMSDVPLGLFLSGGLDSSAILGAVASLGKGARTFSLGFAGEAAGNPEYDEFADAARVAADFGATHQELLVDPSAVPEILPELVWHLDEPLGDPTAIPLYLLARAVGSQVKVVLSGEGADEVFAGYDIYHEPRAVARFQALPSFLRQRILHPLLMSFPEGTPGKDLARRANTDISLRYFGVGKTFSEAEKHRLYSDDYAGSHKMDPREVTRAYFERVNGLDPLDKMLYFDTKVWLPEDTLLKADKMTMAHSLELRVPWLDHHLVEFAAAIPHHFKLRENTVKYILRVALDGLLSPRTLSRRKIGFPVPLRFWLRGTLGETAERIILGKRARERGYFTPAAVRDLIGETPGGSSVHGRKIYTLLILELWHRIFIDGDSPGVLAEEMASPAGNYFPVPELSGELLKETELS